jgi:hypothetical protein
LKEETQQILAAASRKKGKGKAAGVQDDATGEPVKITLTFRKFIFDPHKRMLQ